MFTVFWVGWWVRWFLGGDGCKSAAFRVGVRSRCFGWGSGYVGFWVGMGVSTWRFGWGRVHGVLGGAVVGTLLFGWGRVCRVLGGDAGEYAAFWVEARSWCFGLVGVGLRAVSRHAV